MRLKNITKHGLPQQTNTDICVAYGNNLTYSKKKVNVCTLRFQLWYAPGALLVCSRFAGGTLLVRSSSAVRRDSVRLVWYAHYRLCAHLGFVHVADSCDV